MQTCLKACISLLYMTKAHNFNYSWILSTWGRLFHITKLPSMSHIPLFHSAITLDQIHNTLQCGSPLFHYLASDVKHESQAHLLKALK